MNTGIEGLEYIPGCPCASCIEAELVRKRDEDGDWIGYLSGHRMVLCPTCGNKRCPHATHHSHACTRSNDPGQAGSAYGGLEQHSAPATEVNEGGASRG